MMHDPAGTIHFTERPFHFMHFTVSTSVKRNPQRRIDGPVVRPLPACPAGEAVRWLESTKRSAPSAIPAGSPAGVEERAFLPL
jgi:hypothetical protein